MQKQPFPMHLRIGVLLGGMDETKLIKKAAGGNRRSQNELYKAYYGYAMSVSLRFSNNREEAQEVIHDAFVKMYNNLSKYNTQQDFKSWFRRIIVNTSIDHYRKYNNQPSHLEIIDNDQPVDDDAIANLSAQEIMQAVSMLSPAYRMVFNLYAVEGYTHQEIADKLFITASTSKSNLVKARTRLKAILADHFGIKRNADGKL